MDVVTIESIPKELLLAMFYGFTPKEILKLSLVSKKFHKLSKNDQIWKHVVKISNNQFTSKSKKDYVDYIEIKQFTEYLGKHVNHDNYDFPLISTDIEFDSTIFNRKPIDKIPKKITMFKYLRKFKLYGSRIKEIPDELFDLPDLSIIHLSCNQIREIPMSIENAKYLKELMISAGFISNFPKELCLLQHLQQIDLHCNKIAKLPDEIGLLTNLETLDLHFNKITTIPCSIGNLTKLKRLFLNMNLIETLPKELGELKLEKLDIQKNKLSIIPGKIFENTQTLYCDDNVMNLKAISIIGSFFGL